MNASSGDGIRSILIIQTKFTGDVTLTSALVHNMRLAYPQASVTMLCAPGLKQFIVAQGIADVAVGFETSGRGRTALKRLTDYYAVISALRRRKFDLSIDLTDSKTSRILHRLTGAPLRVGFDPPERPFKFWEIQMANVLAAPFGHGGSHYLYRYLSPLHALGLEYQDPTPRLQPTKLAQEECARLLAENALAKKSYVAVHAGARSEGRRWPPQYFAAVIDEIYAKTGLRSLLVGGPDERPVTQSIVETATSPVATVVGKASLEVLVALLAEAAIFLGNDSGPMHVAASVGTPVVGLFGMQSPDLWGPFVVPNKTLRPSMPCPCIAPGVCKEYNPGAVHCVQRLQVAEVAEATLDLIGEVRKSAHSGMPAAS
ncbi:glycosyltransferase family 9 protein [Mesorhizobium sp. M7A.F.Ca.CA.001.09.2.1]|uniref:Glycosyltransferase family 9 protein n=1 Tax=Mesorhizobium ciceri TaxID=39645 RepID=A0AB38TKX4_9HYPH|nr:MULTISPECIES: glycosyltransferase family 9 protein [Mesorhizobium]RUY55558.1 glycosyltransferase family 9 protein [Mesorhizobium sp. M7A.F.Ca.CA.001.13.2.1]RVA58041.1 glycosyltransferase family 9 protein [Mesorhizobium sp. M7A.F.Ca.US.001.01.1.1]MDF3212426.1 glycosyltransferase family 9 protein [Mesorhizobium ciceri]RUY65176.1 glycosyltransferase family 9 protein [Mesorhizobium sp. M7A.F.Ca.CA.001.13.1.1]RUY66955.1 glycosyltransferase family 9 protein [Mesorhizobium sp. M7A.F.Ca.CA.001.05.1